MAQLMDRRGLDAAAACSIWSLLQTAQLQASPDDVPAMMPACLLMKVRRRALSDDISPAPAPCSAGFAARSAALMRAQCGFSINSRSARSAARSGCF